MCYVDRTNRIVPLVTFLRNYYQISGPFYWAYFIDVFVILRFQNINYALTIPDVDNHRYYILRRLLSEIFSLIFLAEQFAVAVFSLEYTQFYRGSLQRAEIIVSRSYTFLISYRLQGLLFRFLKLLQDFNVNNPATYTNTVSYFGRSSSSRPRRVLWRCDV